MWIETETGLHNLDAYEGVAIMAPEFGEPPGCSGEYFDLVAMRGGRQDILSSLLTAVGVSYFMKKIQRAMEDRDGFLSLQRYESWQQLKKEEVV